MERWPLRGFLLPTRGREVDRKRRPSSGLRVNKYDAAVGFHSTLYDGESESRASHASGGERLEQALLKLVRNARSVVGYAQRDRVFDSRRARQLVRRRAAGANHDRGLGAGRLDGIEHEVRDDAVQQVLVPLHRRRFTFEADLDAGTAVGMLADQPDRR